MQDALTIVEAAYADAADEGAWLQNLVDASSAVDRGLGVNALTTARRQRT